MTDQLSLRLEAGLPRLPGSLRPMLPRTAEAPFDSADHLFEPAWGGERALAFIEPRDREPTPTWRDIRLLDRRGREVAALFPELAGLAARIAATSAILDGELVVVDRAGRADPGALARRLMGSAGPLVAYLVFDLPYLDGRPLLGEPLERRRDALRRILHPGEAVIAVPAIVGDGCALHAAVVAQGIAGIMARQRHSPYLPGVRSLLWRFVPSGAAAADGGAPEDAAAAVDGQRAEPVLELASAPPVLALIQRLPLED